MNELVTVSEACKIVKLSNPTLYKYINDGRLPSEEVEGQKMIKKSDLEKFKQDHKPRKSANPNGRKGKGGKVAASRVAKKHKAKPEELPETPHANASLDEVIVALTTISEKGFTQVVGPSGGARAIEDIVEAYKTLRDTGISS